MLNKTYMKQIEYSNYTVTELLELINKIKLRHDKIKKDIFDKLATLKELEENINILLSDLDKTEEEYIKISEEYLKRK